MARKKKRRGGKSLTNTAFKLLRVASLAAPGIVHYQQVQGDPIKKITYAILGYAGIKSTDMKFHAELLAESWTPYLATCAATYGIPKLTSILRRL